MDTPATVAEMQEHARSAVLSEMCPAHEPAALSGLSDEILRDLGAWRAGGRIFWVEHEGTEYFPFALDPDTDYRPYPAVAAVLAVLPALRESWSRWALASWFIGGNSFLDDQRPRDLLAADPDWIVDAAKNTLHVEAERP